jgi:hypothetical protein
MSAEFQELHELQEITRLYEEAVCQKEVEQKKNKQLYTKLMQLVEGNLGLTVWGGPDASVSVE